VGGHGGGSVTSACQATPGVVSGSGPHNSKQTDRLEGVQRRATKRVKGLANLHHQKKNEGLRSFDPGIGKAEGGPHHSIPVLKGCLQR